MENSGRTLVCSVVFLDIAEYSKKPVAEQLQLKQSFNGILAGALDQVPVRDRIILDTGDGAAIAFIGDPEDALFSAMSIRDSAGALPVRLGVNLGPVRLLKDLNGQMNIIGDGINVAQRVMGFARPGQLLVSRSFYEVVSRLSRDYEKLFFHEGSRTDKHVRAHEVYSVGSGIPAGRRVVDTVARMRENGGGRNWLSATGTAGTESRRAARRVPRVRRAGRNRRNRARQARASREFRRAGRAGARGPRQSERGAGTEVDVEGGAEAGTEGGTEAGARAGRTAPGAQDANRRGSEAWYHSTRDRSLGSGDRRRQRARREPAAAADRRTAGPAYGGDSQYDLPQPCREDRGEGGRGGQNKASLPVSGATATEGRHG